jgi:adenine deaminase
MENFIQGIPKTELHLHIEGTLEPELMFHLAKRNNISLPFQSIEEVRKAYSFQNLQSFLNIYYEGARVLVNEEDFYDLTLSYFKRVAQQNVRHAEIFFDPQTHTRRGIPFSTVISGISSAMREAHSEFGITSKLIMCFLRDLSEDEAFKTLDEAIVHKEKIVAVGLDSAEVGNPPSKFKRVFRKALDEGFLTVAHGGEEGSTDYMWEAIRDLSVSRIDHGVRCVEDPILVERLSRERLPLTVCPLSNIKLCVFDNLKDHPLKRMLDLGLCVTVNSDDPAYFGGYVGENYIATQKALGLSRDEIVTLAKNGFEASFLTTEEKQRHLAQIDEYCRLSSNSTVH